MKKYICLFAFLPVCLSAARAAEGYGAAGSGCVRIKSPGNPAVTYTLTKNPAGELVASGEIPLHITHEVTETPPLTRIKVTVTAREKVYYNYEEICPLPSAPHDGCQFYMPGFWYRRNLRSPKEAPSFYTADSWQVREDRLSTPLTGIYHEKSGDYCTVLRLEKSKDEALATHTSGEVILSGRTSVGFTGFRNISGNAALVFGFPYHEAPRTYIRKLTLIPEVTAFEKLEKGETRELVWEIRKGNAPDFSAFVAGVWDYSFDTFRPEEVKTPYTAESAKAILSNFFTESYVGRCDLKYYSGVHLRTDDCESTGSIEVGFVGRVLLNAFNALEYGEETGNTALVKNAVSIFDSYLAHGFTPAGFFREFVNCETGEEPDIYSIRRQSEGAFAILHYLDYERKKGRKHPGWETKIKTLLGNFHRLQNPDGSFPRKFKDDFTVSDASGGSTPSATLPLAMAYRYFRDASCLESARLTAAYLEKELISQADYFSSTLDANCEDKEASLYASTAMYYLSMVTTGEERGHYAGLCRRAAYFCLSWYYLWDVPFAQGQMLGDVGFLSRGWGNVSVENNHIDVFIFEFAAVLDWLAAEQGEERFSAFSSVIKTSMLQLMPAGGRMFDIGKVGYYPEVVQHTNWDYGRNGKGFYNDIFAPGWTVASLWQMLSPGRTAAFFGRR
jgi:hypothetical protein